MPTASVWPMSVQLRVDSLRNQIVDLLSAQGIHAQNAVNAVQQGWALLVITVLSSYFPDRASWYYGLEDLG